MLQKIIFFLCCLCPFHATANPLEKFVQAEGVHTDAFIIVKDGQVLFEDYYRGYSSNKKHISWSMAKTLSGILIGHAANQGFFSLSDPVKNYLPEFKGSARIEDFLHMASGVQFKEEYSNLPVDSDVVRMLYFKGPELGFAGYSLSLPILSTPPGSYFQYASGNTNVLMEVLRRALPEKEYDQFPWVNLFEPMQISASFEKDASGTYVGSSYMYMSPRDFLKVGEMIRDRGFYNGRLILPEAYFQRLSELSPGVKKAAIESRWDYMTYSAQTYLNQAVPEREIPPTFPNLPYDAIILFGFQGQFIIASPKEKLVLVRLSTDKGDSFRPIRPEYFQAVHDFIEAKGFDYNVAKESHPHFFKESNPKTKGVIPDEKRPGSLSDYFDLPRMLNAFQAKEYCSCHFVLKRSHEQCRDDIAKTLPLMPPSPEIKGQVVTSSFWGWSAVKAQFSGEKFGCALQAVK